MTFPIGSYCYFAILGTPTSQAFARMLINHKYRFGPSAMGSVTVWGSGVVNVDGLETPSLLWWATDKVEEMKTARDENRDRELANPNFGGDLPHRLNPLWKVVAGPARRG